MSGLLASWEVSLTPISHSSFKLNILTPSDERKGRSLNIAIFLLCGFLGWFLVYLVKALIRKLFGCNVPPIFLRIGFAITSSLLLLLAYHFYESVLQSRLSSFDLDGDGIFSPPEQTPEQEVAFENLINDSGRNFVKVLGVVVYWLIAILSAVIRSGGEFVSGEKKQ